MAEFLLVILLASIVCVLPIVTWAAAGSGYPYLIDGKGKIMDDFSGNRESRTVNATDYYFIYVEFSNPAEQPTDLVRVFHIVNVIDDKGYPHFVDGNNYGNHTVAGHAPSEYSFFWNPLVPGNYTVETFLVSDYETPQALTNVVTFQVNVDEKVAALGEGQSNGRLQVDIVNEADNSATISYDYCDEIPPYMHHTSATLHPGEYVSINSVDAYLAEIRGGIATFKFVTNGGSDFCLL
ncbi:hypothetical protein [Candidatus Nitrososphaera sp. FF02]|uniref:hypothetical protein n=1 Tax=Candidatus Nitrososphaera sp. FF02 TaxID=3398226 RepID=UPI0039EA482E